MQTDIFNTAQQVVTKITEIKGLRYVRNFITKQEHDYLLQQIDASVWLDDLKRRVQHYGYKYDYKRRNIDLSMKIGELPSWALQVANKMYAEGLINYLPDQVIINEYQVGQGISPHIDCEPCFEDTIISLSLGSTCVMDFVHKDDKDQKLHKLLEPCSLIILQDEVRYNWFHGIKPNKTDNYNGRKIVRQRRVSLTFRKVILNEKNKNRC
jgi:alkylated DNA repair dioxygenase AlkB